MAHQNINANMFDRGIHRADTGSYDNEGAQVVPLPLNLIALIISYLDQPADLARACRTCRVLHYMTLPQLYSNVSLHSYDYIRYSPLTGRAEGCGGASPFSMGLNGLVTRNVAGYVRKFRLWGEFKEYDLEECAKVGRVPDGSMMLNCLVRAAVEKMGVLESFSWELNTKMLPTVWQGLAQKQTLRSLAVKFPSVRLPRPTVLVPPIPTLQSLKITDIDPLCYPDDISLLLLESKRLQDLTLHWNPRMRNDREPSVSLHAYFGRLLAREHTLALKSVTFANLYATNNGGFDEVLDPKTLKEITFINSMGGAGDSGDTAFIDLSWAMHSHKQTPSPTMVRGDKISRLYIEFLGSSTGIERYYLIGATQPCEKQSNGHHVRTPSDTATLYPSTPVVSTPSTPIDPTAISLGKEYIDVVCKNHGSTLRHLLFKPQWRLSSEDLARLVRCCPNLEQLGIGVEVANIEMLCLLIPFLPKLSALRILGDPHNGAFAEALKQCGDDAFCESNLGPGLAKPEYSRLRWLGLGDLVFQIKGLVMSDEVDKNGEKILIREVTRASREDVQHVEIWGLDSLEV